MLYSFNSNEKISIKGFLSISKCEISLTRITAFIGPQAAGKSVVVKLIYFCREYLEDFFRLAANTDFSLKEFKEGKLKSLFSLFKGLNEFDKTFSVRYDFGGLFVEITKGKPNHQIKFSHSGEMNRIGTFLRRRYTKYISDLATTRGRNLGLSIYEFMESDDELTAFYSALPSTLFVRGSTLDRRRMKL